MSTQAESLWARLQRAGLVDGVMPDTAASDSPWYVRVMLGVSGWLAALFVLGFVATGLRFVVQNELAMIVLGLMLLVAAYAILSLKGNAFLRQFGVAISLVGQLLVLIGLAELSDWRWGAIWWWIALVEGLVALLMPSFVQRLVAAGIAVYALEAALGYRGVVVPVLATGSVVLIWMNEFGWARWGRWLRPIGYGVTLALVYQQASLLFHRLRSWWPSDDLADALMSSRWSALAVGLVLIALVAWLLVRNQVRWTSRAAIGALLAATALAGVSFEMPGLAVGCIVTLLGFAQGNRVLLGLGIMSLLFFIAGYYYSLHSTLLVKSGLLLATGLVLLLARWLALRWMPPAPEPSDA